MAQLVTHLVGETELLHDALNEVGRIGGALVSRHGDVFRALDRAIEALIESGDWVGEAKDVPGDPGECRFVLMPSAAVRDIIARAARLGI